MSKIPLLARAAIALVAVGLVPLGIAFSMLTGINREGMTKQILRTHAVAASTAAKRIESLVDARLAAARALAASEALDAEMLQAALRGDASLAAIAVLGPDGAERLRVQRKETAGDMPALLRNTTTTVQAIHGRPWLVVTADNVRVVADATPLAAALDPKELGSEAQMAVVANGRMLLGAGTFPPEMLSESRNAQVDGAGVFGTGERSVVGAHAGVDGTNWVVLSRQPAAIARAVEADMRRGSLSAVAVALVLAAVAAVLAWLTIVRPLRGLAEAQRRVVGDVAAEGTEIDQLREGFAVLERRKHDQEDLGRIFLGRYQVLELLGEGGMGSVFRGWDPRLQRTVALKTIRFTTDSEHGAERSKLAGLLVREAVTIAQFNHPNIVQIFDAEESASGAYLAMELVDGLSLEKYVSRKRTLTPDEATLIGLAIAKALTVAHAQGIVHRDIKPANVLLDRNGGIKVTDFGLADIMSSVRVDGFVYGTAGYIAPECVTGGAATVASDLFSLGVLLYDCLTGNTPFQGTTVAGMLLSTVHIDPAPLREVNEAVDDELDYVVMTLLEKNPAARFSSAAVLAGHLEQRAATRGLRWTFADPLDGGDSGRATAEHAQFLRTLHQRPTLKLAG